MGKSPVWVLVPFASLARPCCSGWPQAHPSCRKDISWVSSGLDWCRPINHTCRQVSDVRPAQDSQHPAPTWGCRMLGRIGRPTSDTTVFMHDRFLAKDLSCVHTRDLLCAQNKSLVCTQEMSCVHTRDLLCAHKRSLVCTHERSFA